MSPPPIYFSEGSRVQLFWDTLWDFAHISQVWTFNFVLRIFCCPLAGKRRFDLLTSISTASPIISFLLIMIRSIAFVSIWLCQHFYIWATEQQSFHSSFSEWLLFSIELIITTCRHWLDFLTGVNSKLFLRSVNSSVIFQTIVCISSLIFLRNYPWLELIMWQISSCDRLHHVTVAVMLTLPLSSL